MPGWAHMSAALQTLGKFQDQEPTLMQPSEMFFSLENSPHEPLFIIFLDPISSHTADPVFHGMHFGNWGTLFIFKG